MITMMRTIRSYCKIWQNSSVLFNEISSNRIASKAVNGSSSIYSCRTWYGKASIQSTNANPTCLPAKYLHQSAFLYANKNILKEKKGKSKPRVELRDEEIMEVVRVDVLRNQLDYVLIKLKETFTQQLSTRMAAESLEKIEIPVEGELYPLIELAQIIKKNPQLVAINMINFPEVTKTVIQEIQQSGINVSIQQDGTMIFVTIPKVTRAHREEQVKKAKVMLNKAKDELRDIQNRFIREAKKKDSFSEDLIFNIQENIKFMTTEQIAEGDKMLKMKEKELLGDV